MNKLFRIIVISAISVFLASNATADHTKTIRGSFFGTVFQNHMDLDGDGLNGRSGTLRVRNSRGNGHGRYGRNGRFGYFDVNTDTTADLNNLQGSCDAGEIELFPYGEGALSTFNGKNAIFVKIDSSVSLCFGLVPEEIALKITGGRGIYEGATGTGTAILPDDMVLNADFSINPPFPRVVYVNDGSFELNVKMSNY